MSVSIFTTRPELVAHGFATFDTRRQRTAKLVHHELFPTRPESKSHHPLHFSLRTFWRDLPISVNLQISRIR